MCDDPRGAVGHEAAVGAGKVPRRTTLPQATMSPGAHEIADHPAPVPVYALRYLRKVALRKRVDDAFWSRARTWAGGTLRLRGRSLRVTRSPTGRWSSSLSRCALMSSSNLLTPGFARRMWSAGGVKKPARNRTSSY
jgi:hypothetical protein